MASEHWLYDATAFTQSRPTDARPHMRSPFLAFHVRVGTHSTPAAHPKSHAGSLSSPRPGTGRYYSPRHGMTWPARHCSPRHGMPLNSRIESSRCVPMTWRARFGRPRPPYPQHYAAHRRVARRHVPPAPVHIFVFRVLGRFGAEKHRIRRNCTSRVWLQPPLRHRPGHDQAGGAQVDIELK